MSIQLQSYNILNKLFNVSKQCESWPADRGCISRSCVADRPLWICCSIRWRWYSSLNGVQNGRRPSTIAYMMIPLQRTPADRALNSKLHWQEARLPQRKRASAVIKPFKLIRGHRFWYQSKARTVCDFPLANNANLCPISHRFQVISDYWSNIRFRQEVPLLTPSFGETP